jgi:hypothetical protein
VQWVSNRFSHCNGNRIHMHQVSKSTLIILASAAALIAIASHFTPLTLTASPPTTALSTESVYLLYAVGACRGPAGYTPCFGGNITQAEIFNCGNAATLPSGCIRSVVNPSNPLLSFQITIWYPYVTQSNEPSWANCKYQSSGDPGQQYFANCISTNSTAFIVAEPGPPPV